MTLDKCVLYPLTGLCSAILILFSALIFAKTMACTAFLGAVLVWLCLFGCGRAVRRVVPAALVVGGFFALFTYLGAHNALSALWMANRAVALCLAVVPGMSITPVQMTRCLTRLHTPRFITLGMLISLSFAPLLGTEIRRVREAMTTRGAVSLYSPKVLYRAFLIPLITRLVNISDTLSLSVESRGFSITGGESSIYHQRLFTPKDGVYLLGVVALVCALGVMA